MNAPPEEIQLIVNKSVAHFSCNPSATLARYLADVLEWNAVLGLISRKDPLAALERLLFESIELGQALDIEHARRVADVGSGAGFPGLVWALMFPDLDVTLIERREKRALFLERSSRTLGASRVTVIAKDLADVSRETSLAPFDVVSTVAVGEPASIADDVERMLTSEGRFASTVKKAASSPERIGHHLHLLERIEGKFGCYIIYCRGV